MYERDRRRYHLDNVVFERANRLFCSRLEERGLAARQDVAAELARGRLCGATRFDNIQDVCGPLETPESYAKLVEACEGTRPFPNFAKIPCSGARAL